MTRTSMRVVTSAMVRQAIRSGGERDVGVKIGEVVSEKEDDSGGR